jgi:hypothetical protein
MPVVMVSVDTCPWTSRSSHSSRLVAIRRWSEVRSRSYASFRAGPSAGDHDVIAAAVSWCLS